MSLTVTPEVISANNAISEKALAYVESIIDAPDWTVTKQEPTITFYSRYESSSPFAQIKSVVSIPASLEKVMAVLDVVVPVDANTPAKQRDGCQERYVTNPVPGDPNSAIFNYVALETPTRIVAPRDFLLYRRKYPFRGGFVWLHTSVADESLKPVKSPFVRGKMTYEADIAYPDPETPGAVRMIFATHADPAGSIPAWVYNAVATDQGYFAKQVRDKVLGEA
jgi:hypothetical protein